MGDDDLIRRGDALYAIAGWEIPSTAIAALPPAKQDNVAISNARGVGVPTEAQFMDAVWAALKADATDLGKQQRILAAFRAALEPAPTDAAQASAEDAHVKGETTGQMLERLGMDGAKWAAEFRTTALRLGYSDMDEGWLVGWFCNAIMAGHDRSAAQAREAALPDIVAVLTDAAAVAMKAREAALREAADAVKRWYRQWSMYSGGNEPTRDDRAGGITYGRLQSAETIAADILALIGEKPREQRE